jgi:hypothetical protein
MGNKVLRAGVKVLVEFKGVLDVICFEENKISCTKLYHRTSTKRAAIKLDGRTNSIASTVGSTTERFSGVREEEYHENID